MLFVHSIVCFSSPRRCRRRGLWFVACRLSFVIRRLFVYLRCWSTLSVIQSVRLSLSLLCFGFWVLGPSSRLLAAALVPAAGCRFRLGLLLLSSSSFFFFLPSSFLPSSFLLPCSFTSKSDLLYDALSPQLQPLFRSHSACTNTTNTTNLFIHSSLGHHNKTVYPRCPASSNVALRFITASFDLCRIRDYVILTCGHRRGPSSLGRRSVRPSVALDGRTAALPKESSQ